MPIVREIRPDEHAEAAAVTVAGYAAFYGDLGPYGAALADVPARARAAVVLAAFEGGRIVGTVTYVPDHHNRFAEHLREGEASIRMLSVLPEWQGRAIGRALSEACLERARAAGKRAVLLHADEIMPVAQRLYARLGFARDPSRDFVAEDGTRLLAWLRPLR